MAGRLEPTPTQRRVLIQLVRPWFVHGDTVRVAPSNKDIADRLDYAHSTVRDAISDLYAQAGLTGRRSPGNSSC